LLLLKNVAHATWSQKRVLSMKKMAMFFFVESLFGSPRKRIDRLSRSPGQVSLLRSGYCWLFDNPGHRAERHLSRAAPEPSFTRRIFGWLIVGDGPPGRAVEIVILAALERPEKARQADGSERERERNEKHENFHQAASLF